MVNGVESSGDVEEDEDGEMDGVCTVSVLCLERKPD